MYGDYLRRSVIESLIGLTAVGTVGSETVRGDDCSPIGALSPDEPAGDIRVWYTDYFGSGSRLDSGAAEFSSSTRHTAETRDFSSREYTGSVTESLTSVNDPNDSFGSPDPPHVFAHTHRQVPGFHSDGLLSGQRDALGTENCLFVDPAVEAATADGELVGLPWGGVTPVLYYDSSIVGVAPESTDMLLTQMARYQDTSADQYGIACSITTYWLSGFAQAFGTRMYDPESDELQLTSDAVIDGLGLFLEQFSDFTDDAVSPASQRELFENGNAVFYIGGSWEYTSLQESLGSVGVAPLPKFSNGDRLKPFADFHLLLFSSLVESSDSGGTARDFAEWISTNTQWATNLANRTQVSPVLSTLLDGGLLTDDQRVVVQQLENSVPVPRPGRANQMWGPITRALQDTFAGEGTLENNLAEAQETVHAEWGSSASVPSPQLPGTQNQARDVDGDVLLEDVNGDGTTNVFDALTYYNKRDSQAVQQNPDMFDFDGDGTPGTIFDALELYNEISS